MGRHRKEMSYARSRSVASIALVGVVAVAVVIWGSLVGHASDNPSTVSGAPTLPVGSSGTVVPTPGQTVSPVSVTHRPSPSASPSATPSPTPSVPATAGQPGSPYSVSYGFDGGVGNLSLGLNGSLPLVVVSAAGGTLSTTTRDGGDAIAYPAVCAQSEDESCPRVILETTGDASRLNPGTQRVRYGATINLRSDQTGDGENVVQKGYATGGSEYKLQVDGFAGVPSCVVVGTTSNQIYLAKASVAIDDGTWHAVSCDLHAGTLSITVDGVASGSVAVPTTLVISNPNPLRIGGKGTGTNNDQFAGALDDVWVTVG
jgi:hypothetical protein